MQPNLTSSLDAAPLAALTEAERALAPAADDTRTIIKPTMRRRTSAAQRYNEGAKLRLEMLGQGAANDSPIAQHLLAVNRG